MGANSLSVMPIALYATISILGCSVPAKQDTNISEEVLVYDVVSTNIPFGTNAELYDIQANFPRLEGAMDVRFIVENNTNAWQQAELEAIHFICKLEDGCVNLGSIGKDCFPNKNLVLCTIPIMSPYNVEHSKEQRGELASGLIRFISQTLEEKSLDYSKIVLLSIDIVPAQKKAKHSDASFPASYSIQFNSSGDVSSYQKYDI